MPSSSLPSPITARPIAGNSAAHDQLADLRATLEAERAARVRAEQLVEHWQHLYRSAEDKIAELQSRARGDARQIDYLEDELAIARNKLESSRKRMKAATARIKKLTETKE